MKGMRKLNKAIPVTEQIYWVGVNDRETDLFESIWPLPHGVAYNAYLILDQKVALIDTVKITYQDSFLDKIRELLGDKELDYLIVNHMEPDHSGAIKALRALYPRLEIVGNKKTVGFLNGFYGIKDGIKVVKDGDQIELGEHKLSFYLTPMVHWPETMMTYEEKNKVLFSGDAFGGYAALNGSIFADQLDLAFYEEESRRYFSTIVAKYSPMVQKALSKLAGLDTKIIASTHGPVWKNNPEYIINRYDRWSSNQTEEGVVIVYGSMYGNTKVIAEAIAENLVKEGIAKICLYDAARTDLSYMLRDIWQYRGLIVGSCTYNTELFPPVAALISALLNRRIEQRVLGIFGSYSWSSGAVKALQSFYDNQNVKCELISPVIDAQYAPNGDVITQCEQLARNMAAVVNK